MEGGRDLAEENCIFEGGNHIVGGCRYYKKGEALINCTIHMAML